ncbi:MAG: hypothetical protein ACSI46_10720 [Gloeotrichia echinulata DVL01]|jgi:hypothetical protein
MTIRLGYSDFQVNEPHFYISRIRVASRREGAFAERLAEKAQRKKEIQMSGCGLNT